DHVGRLRPGGETEGGRVGGGHVEPVHLASGDVQATGREVDRLDASAGRGHRPGGDEPLEALVVDADAHVPGAGRDVQNDAIDRGVAGRGPPRAKPASHARYA